MALLGSLIGAGLGLASTIAGGISNSNARKQQRRMLSQQQKENQAWYDRKYNEDPTKRADTVHLLTQMNDTVKNRNKAARGRQAVMGGTEDSTTVVKEANNKTVADTTAQIVSANEARKDNIEQQFLNRKQQIQDQQMGMKSQDAANTANVVAGVAGTAANIANALDGGGEKSPKPIGTASQQVAMATKDAGDPLGMKKPVTATPNPSELNDLASKLPKA